MTGLDFSGLAVEAAAELGARAGANATFVRSDVYAAPDVLGTGGFDLVYTGVGALPWLPDIRRWARVVAALLRPGGRMRHTVMHQWNHGIGEIVTALLEAGMRVTGLAEHDSVPWDALPGLMEPVTERRMAGSEWRLAADPRRLPTRSRCKRSGTSNTPCLTARGASCRGGAT
jgi:SAM-dependent methyltransferase